MAANDGGRSRCKWRGWLVVALVAVEWGLVQGPAFNYSIFLLSFQREFNTSTALTGWVGAVAHSLLNVGVVPAAGLQQWLAPRSIAMIGMFLNCGGFFLTSFVPSLWYAFLTYGIAVGLGMGFILHAGVSLCLSWFPTKHTVRVNALTTFGTPCGTLISARVMTTLISAYGWRRAFMITSGGIFVISGTVTMFLTTPKLLEENLKKEEIKIQPYEQIRHADERRDTSGKQRRCRSQTPFYRHCEPWLWFYGTILGALSWTFVAINLASYMDSIGLTSDDIALAIMILSIGQLTGKALVVLFGDFLPFLKMYVIAMSFAMCAVTSGVLIFVSSLPPLLVCSFGEHS